MQVHYREGLPRRKDEKGLPMLSVGFLHPPPVPNTSICLYLITDVLGRALFGRVGQNLAAKFCPMTLWIGQYYYLFGRDRPEAPINIICMLSCDQSTHICKIAITAMIMLWLAAVLLTSAVSDGLRFHPRTGIVSLSPREMVNFDFAWRFHLGELGFACGDDFFPVKHDLVECTGLQHVDNVTNLDDCRDTCCADMLCSIWQFAEPEGCWIGQSNDCSHKSTQWVGGGRPLPPAPYEIGPTSRDYDDSAWELVDVPHDGIIALPYAGVNGSNTRIGFQGYLPPDITWYRKHFNLPEDWKGQSIWVYFEGVFRASVITLNGEFLLYHDSGYTSFSVRLDNASTVLYGDGKENENVISVKADPTGGSGWWYEGGGIYRHTYLVKASPVHIAVDSIYGASDVIGLIVANTPKDPSQGMYADMAMFFPRAEVVNDHETGSYQNIQVHFTVFDEAGVAVGSVNTSNLSISPAHTVAVDATMKMSNVQLWSPARPYLYTLQTEVVITGSTVLDAVNTSIGLRHAIWDPDTGFYLNKVPFTWRGFNNHDDFTGVGTAVPDRVNLFRAQSLRAVGGNSWRMSHNPPIPALLDILDQVGVVVWNENRQFGNNSVWVWDQKDMVRRDRNHPSIMVWSFCNEINCILLPSTDETVPNEFKEVSNKEDPFRPVTANMNSQIGGGLSKVIDIQGLSHKPSSDFVSFHHQFPEKPLIASECCSCFTQRDEDVTDVSRKVLGSFNANCTKIDTNYSLALKFTAGCMVWTLFDYYGEPTPYWWPMVSSSFGSIDLAGFPKASAYWYRAWWLYGGSVSPGREDVPFNPPPLDSGSSEENGYLVHIVQHWEPREDGSPRTIQVFTNAPMVDLLLNNKSLGVKKVDLMGWAQWDQVSFSPGNLTAIALDEGLKNMATHTVCTCGAPVKVVASVDVPSEKTGTGMALLLDGEDAGMVRASIVDSAGRVVQSSTHNVTFRVVSGPGRIIGVGNGDPSCHEPNHVPWRSAYHGLARAIIQVTEDNATSVEHRRRLLQIDREGGVRTRIIPPEASIKASKEIVVEASVAGLGSSSVSIPVSSDAATDSVLSVARKSLTPDSNN